MRVAVVGYGVDGASAVGYWHKLGADVTVCDQKEDILLPNYVTPKLGAGYLAGLDAFDVIVRSPGVRPDEITAANPESKDIQTKVTTCINEFFAKCPAPIIGVTGTKGKGTTSTLIYKMLQAAGKSVFIGGNIGIVPLDFLHEITPESFVVLELSNFQLFDFTSRPQIGVCLMIVPEHQDWHHNVEEYYAAKMNLFKNQLDTDKAVYNAGNLLSKKIVEGSKAQKIPYYVGEQGLQASQTASVYVKDGVIFAGTNEVCKTSDVALLGQHNLENACAAIAAVWEITGGNKQAITTTLQTFTGLEHRLEFVREFDGVKYYNDSFATTPEASIAAIRAFDQPKVLILGGSDKGIPFFELANEVANSNVRHVITVGDTGPKIGEQLSARGVDAQTVGGTTMPEIVAAARSVAKQGDIVLLSTGSASFGLFKDYKDRGDKFKAAVNALA